MGDSQLGMMQRDILFPRHKLGSIFFIARNRTSDGSKLRADLVVAAGFEVDFEQGQIAKLLECPVAQDGALRTFVAFPANLGTMVFVCNPMAQFGPWLLRSMKQLLVEPLFH